MHTKTHRAAGLGQFKQRFLRRDYARRPDWMGPEPVGPACAWGRKDALAMRGGVGRSK